MRYYTDEAREDRLEARAERIEAEAARVGPGLDAPYTALNPDELQPCGHPVEAIRSSPYIGEQHSNWCGWCEEVGQLQAEVARLREALEGLKHADGCYCEAAFAMLDGSHPQHWEECEAACDALDALDALDATADERKGDNG